MMELLAAIACALSSIAGVETAECELIGAPEPPPISAPAAAPPPPPVAPISVEPPADALVKVGGAG